jgi:hypothetical protein
MARRVFIKRRDDLHKAAPTKMDLVAVQHDNENRRVAEHSIRRASCRKFSPTFGDGCGFSLVDPGQPSLRRRSRNASMAGTAGSRSNASGAKQRPASRSRTSPALQHTDIEAGSRPEMPIMPHAPPVHLIKLTKQREMDPYFWVHPDEER